MTEKSGPDSAACCGGEPVLAAAKCCKIDALISIDGRGQIVLPKDVRDKIGVRAGDKFAVISCESEGKVTCITLVKTDDFAETIKGMLGPMLKDILQ